MTDLSSYKALYLQTAYDYVTALQKNLIILNTDLNSTQALEILHRSAHSLKSQSLVMGYESIGNISMKIEQIFRRIQDKENSFSNELFAALDQSFQKLYDSLKSIETQDKEIDLSNDLNLLNKF